MGLRLGLPTLFRSIRSGAVGLSVILEWGCLNLEMQVSVASRCDFVGVKHEIKTFLLRVDTGINRHSCYGLFSIELT